MSRVITSEKHSFIIAAAAARLAVRVKIRRLLSVVLIQVPVTNEATDLLYVTLFFYAYQEQPAVEARFKHYHDGSNANAHILR